MLKSLLGKFSLQATRAFSTNKPNNFKVAILGAAGGIGEPLSLLMKLNPLVTELSLFDIVKTPGVGADLSHIDTKSKVHAFCGEDQLCDALKNANVVVIPAGVPRKPGMTRDDLFNVNAGIIKNIINVISFVCPKALVAIITNPVNSVIPIAAEVMKANGTYDPKRLFGVTTLDTVRARAFIGQLTDTDPQCVEVPVIGGHSGITIIPVLSQSKPPVKGDQKAIEALTHRIQEAGTEIVEAKNGAGSATLSMAYAASRFTNSLMRGLKGEKDVIEPAYVESCVTEASFFATPLRLGSNGIEEDLGLPKLNDFEKHLLECALPELKKNIEKGIEFAKKK